MARGDWPGFRSQTRLYFSPDPDDFMSFGFGQSEIIEIIVVTHEGKWRLTRYVDHKGIERPDDPKFHAERIE